MTPLPSIERVASASVWRTLVALRCRDVAGLRSSPARPVSAGLRASMLRKSGGFRSRATIAGRVGVGDVLGEHALTLAKPGHALGERVEERNAG